VVTWTGDAEGIDCLDVTAAAANTTATITVTDEGSMSCAFT
jgi:hypothetical protein